MRAKLATLTTTAALVVAVIVTACTTTKTEKTAKTGAGDMPSFGAPANDVPIPKCLNVQEGDRHVEFNGTSLFLAENGAPKELPLEQGARVRCEKFEIIRKARKPSVLIEYATPQEGAVFELKLAIATIADGKWIVKPVTIKRQTAEKTIEEKIVKWSEDKNGKAILTLSDSKSKKTIKP